MLTIHSFIKKSLTVFALFFGAVAAAQVSAVDRDNVAIGGYSPVSYFTKGRAELGNARFAVENDGQVFWLTSQEQVETFNTEPEKYRPRHRSCPYSLAYGMVLPLDPTNFKIVGGHLLLFHRSPEKDALLEWNESELSEEELLERADANIFLIKF